MASSDTPNTALDRNLFDSRLLLEIEQWECTYHLALSSDLIPPEYRFQGGLSFSRGFELSGRVVAPARFRDRRFRIWMSPFGADWKFGRNEMDEVGRVYFVPQKGITSGSAITLFFPEATLDTVSTCLASVWKYLDVFTFGEDPDEASVSGFSFTKGIDQALMPWVSGDRA